MRSLGIETELLHNLSKNSLYKLVKNENPNRSPVTINNFHTFFKWDIDAVISSSSFNFLLDDFSAARNPKNAKKTR